MAGVGGIYKDLEGEDREEVSSKTGYRDVLSCFEERGAWRASYRSVDVVIVLIKNP